VFYGVDDSIVAKDHCDQWHQVCKEKDRESHYLLSNIAAVDAPRYTCSFDDVRARETNDYLIHGIEGPREHDSSIQQTLFLGSLQ